MNPEPKVVFWYKMYCLTLVVLYGLVAVAGLGILLVPAEEMGLVGMERWLMAGVLIGMGLPLAAACALPFFFPPRKWLWVYGLIMIAIGMTSCCYLPVCIPLLIFWIKDDTQRYFGDASKRNQP
jgi:hypothetical protein